MCKEWRHPLHHQWAQLHESGAGHQRRRHGGRAIRVHAGVQDEVGGHDTKLWADMAEYHERERPEPILHGDHQRWPDRGLQRRSTARLGLRPDI